MSQNSKELVKNHWDITVHTSEVFREYLVQERAVQLKLNAPSSLKVGFRDQLNNQLTYLFLLNSNLN